MHIPHQKMTPFLERISNINFDKHYTPLIRVLCHMSMWIFFSSLLFLYYIMEIKLPLIVSFLVTSRAAINNIVVFYLLFYLVIPYIIKGRFGILFLILCLPLAVYTWLFVNHLQLVVLNYFNIDIHNGPLKDIIKKNAALKLSEALSVETVLGNTIQVIYSFSPLFFTKMLFDSTRLFSRTIFFQKQTLDLELQNLNIEKDFLKSQLNPHFLFNTMNNLYGLVVKNDPSAPQTIISISNLMAYSLYESDTEKVALEKELDFIRNYFSLEKMRHSKNKDISLNIDAPEEMQNLMIAPLLTFTFIENAFKYGLKEQENNFVKININIADNIFNFLIENNKEKSPSKKASLGGIGIKNIEKRLALIYPDKHEFKIEDKETYFSVSLSINLK